MKIATVAATRPLSLDDTAALIELVRRNRDYLAPWQPVRDQSFYTPMDSEPSWRSPSTDASTVSRGHWSFSTSLSRWSVRGPFLSGAIDYWVDEAHTRHGLAITVVGEMVHCA